MNDVYICDLRRIALDSRDTWPAEVALTHSDRPCLLEKEGRKTFYITTAWKDMLRIY